MSDIATLTLKIDSLEARVAKKDLEDLEAQGKKNVTSAGALGDEFKKLAAIMGPAALATGFALAVKSSIELEEHYVRLSEIAGTTAAMMSAMDLPARLAGTSLDTVASSIAKLGRSIGEAQLGDVQKQGIFKAFGINPKDGRDAAEVMVDVAKALVNMKDQNVAGAASLQLLGRGYAEIRPFLKELVEQGGVHARVTNEQAAAAKHFEDELTKLNFQMGEAKIKMANDLIPYLTQVVEKMNEASTSGGGFFAVLSAGMHAAVGSDDMTKANDQIKSLTVTINYLQEKLNASTYSRNMSDSWLGQLLGSTTTEELQKRLADAQSELAVVQGFKKQIEDAKKPKAAPDGIDEHALNGVIAEAGVRKLMEDQKLYEARVNAEKGFSDQYSEAIKTGNILAQEAHKQGLISEETLIRQMGANEDAKLKVMLLSLEKQAELAHGVGNKGKESEALAAAKTVNAAIVSNEAITQAKITSLRETTELAYRRTIEMRMLAIQEGQQTESEILETKLAEQSNVLEIWRGDNADREQEYWIRLANLYAEYENKKSEITDAEVKRRYGIQEVYHQLDFNSARSWLGNMSVLMNTKSRELFEIGKVAAIGKAIMDTYSAATGAYAAMSSIPFVGPALGAAAAAAAIAAGLANVSAIRSQSYGSSGGGASGTFSASPTTGLPTGSPLADSAQSNQKPSNPATVIHLHGDTYSGQQIQDLFDKINEGQRDGGRFEVVQ